MAFRKVLPVLGVVFFFGTTALASEANQLCPEVLKGWIFEGKPVEIVDVQGPEDFEAHNYEGSVSAYDSKILDLMAQRLSQKGETKVVVVSARGGDDALVAAEHLMSGGVSPWRILILEGGMEAALSSSGTCGCCRVEAKPQ